MWCWEEVSVAPFATVESAMLSRSVEQSIRLGAEERSSLGYRWPWGKKMSDNDVSSPATRVTLCHRRLKSGFIHGPVQCLRSGLPGCWIVAWMYERLESPDSEEYPEDRWCTRVIRKSFHGDESQGLDSNVNATDKSHATALRYHSYQGP